MSVSVKPATLGTATVDQRIPLSDSDARWVGLRLYEWTDQEGNKRKWEVATRKTTSAGGVDAVAVAAILEHPSRPLSIPIILQYRPPVGTICVELPAGLIDKGENPTQAGLREMYEETGYGGDKFEGRIKVIELGGVVPSDPGMSTANMHLCTIEVQLKEGEETPVAKLEPGEHIEVRVTPLNDLYAHLEAYEKLGYSVDARLHHYAAGIEVAKRYGLGLAK